MAVGTEQVEFAPGYLTLTDSHGRKTAYPIAPVIRAVDVPVGLTYSQVGGLTTLANIAGLLAKILIEAEVIDESLLNDEGYNLESVITAIEELGGDYVEPDLSVS
uniref:Uncharacterized protein n=1 Tax=viral metagenome TaxID=1070528 RepID=A0A6M3IQV0_9ZZZZ